VIALPDLVAELSQACLRHPHATDKLLQRFVASHTFPILDGNSATFFFWDGNPPDSIHLINWVFGLESRLPMVPVPGTNAFWLQVELPQGARVEYKLELQSRGQRAWIRDPLNPNQAFDPFGSNSVCPMPGYIEPPWAQVQPECRPGSLEHFTLQSTVWGDSRTITVYLPNEHKPTRKYPLLVCHDGSDYLRFAGIKTVLDNLIGRQEVKPLIVAFVDGGNRNAEYGAHPDHPCFIVDELLPALEARYGLQADPEDRGIMGASFGGVASLWTAWSRPGTFGRLLLQSGSFAFTDVGTHGRGPLWDPVVKFVNAFRMDLTRPIRGVADPRVFMSCGVFESLIHYNRTLAPGLVRAGVPVRFIEAQDGHNWICWRDRLRDALTWLFPGHLWMVYE
jgi:enterochelin esterase family protein